MAPSLWSLVPCGSFFSSLFPFGTASRVNTMAFHEIPQLCSLRTFPSSFAVVSRLSSLYLQPLSRNVVSPLESNDIAEYILVVSCRYLNAPSASVNPRFTTVAPTRPDLSSLFRSLGLDFVVDYLMPYKLVSHHLLSG